MGPQGVFSIQKGNELMSYIQLLESSGFAPECNVVRRLDFQFAEKLDSNSYLAIKHKLAMKVD
jgi:hypothetical protein